MSDYGTSRDSQYAFRLHDALEQFVSQYGANPSRSRRTIFLFPGGLGSQLMRANKPHPQLPQYYEKSWLDCGILSGDGLNLSMLPGDVDFEEHYIVPEGCVDFVLARPYANFIQWCRNNWIDLFVFGWDWRRGVQDSAEFFLKVFMPMLDIRFAGHTPHPLDNFTLIGHSSGGMVVKMILNASDDQYVQRMKKAITVATPFYGYGGQPHRFLKGDPDLNWTEPNGASVYTRVISSMPGMYEFLYLDYETYESNMDAFADDPEGYNLDAYPSLDKVNPAEVADPYDPQPDAQGRVRYPLHYGFDSTLLYKGKVESRKVSSALDPSIAAKLYNIRGVQSRDGNVLNNTVVGQSWERVLDSFDPDTDPDPIDDKLGPGDDTQPAWTTRFLGLPDPAHQVITIVDDAEHMHMMMMGNPKVQVKIAEMLELDPRALTFTREDMEGLVASRIELNKFLDELRERIAAKELTPERRKIMIAEYLRTFRPDELHKLFARAYLDALKSPSQKTGRSLGSDRAKESKPAPRRKR
jgi:pimeloyl-ACP methyl ester carboxylesterase